MFIPKEIIQNALLGLGPLWSLAKRRHRTGMMGDPARVAEAYGFFTAAGPVAGKSIMELGPGQTLDVLARAKAAGAARCVALDITRYVSDEAAAVAGVEYILYDGQRMPLEAASFDAVWAWDVLEHLRDPAGTLAEVARVLRPGGVLACRIDLRDHYHLDDPRHWLDCLRYSNRLWRAMTSNRSSFVNRLRWSNWQDLLAAAGFDRVSARTYQEQALTKYYADLGLAGEDLTTWRVDGVWRR